MVGSPFKKARPSLPGIDGAMVSALNDVDPPSNNVAPAPQTISGTGDQQAKATMDEDEEL